MVEQAVVVAAVMGVAVVVLEVERAAEQMWAVMPIRQPAWARVLVALEMAVDRARGRGKD
jgi:hypothetical protein